MASSLGETLRVQTVEHRDGQQSYLVLDVAAGVVHRRADRFLARFKEGTQRTYAYHLVDHLRWLARYGYREETVTAEELGRYLALCGTERAGPLGSPWRARPLSDSALQVRAGCLKGYYLDMTSREGVNEPLRELLSQRRQITGQERNRIFLGHLAASAPANPLAPPAPPRKYPRMLPDGAAVALLDVVHTARDRMIITWLADAGLRIGELCGLWFCDLHLVSDHRCGQRAGPHVHLVKRRNENRARAKTAPEARIVDGMITGGTVRRVSPAMVTSYHEYLIEDYHRLRAAADGTAVLVQLSGERAGKGLSPHGARQMLERAGRRAGLGLITPHAFRHTWASALAEATGGNTKAVADEGGWASVTTVNETYAHLAGSARLEAALTQVWSTP